MTLHFKTILLSLSTVAIVLTTSSYVSAQEVTSDIAAPIPAPIAADEIKPDNLEQINPAISTNQDESDQKKPITDATANKPNEKLQEPDLIATQKMNPDLTDDQKAMTAEELLTDPDLLTPLTKVIQSETIDSDDDEDADEYETEFFAPEEISLNDDYLIPEYAQQLLDDSHPYYYPPTGKLFGFMRRHLLKRGDSPKPWTVTDDFNGDGKPDWAALMVNKEQQLDVIVIYSEDNNYRLEVLFEAAGIDNDSIKIALSQEKPGDKVGASYKNKPGKFRTASLEFPGINIMYYTKSSSLFYWHNYYFDELLTSR